MSEQPINQSQEVSTTVPQTVQHVGEQAVAATAGNYINRMAPPSDEQIAKAAQHGFDLTKQAKYYSAAEWAGRNQPR